MISKPEPGYGVWLHLICGTEGCGKKFIFLRRFRRHCRLVHGYGR